MEGGHACHGTYVEIRGQLGGVGSLLPLWVLGIKLQSWCLVADTFTRATLPIQFFFLNFFVFIIELCQWIFWSLEKICWRGTRPTAYSDMVKKNKSKYDKHNNWIWVKVYTSSLYYFWSFSVSLKFFQIKSQNTGRCQLFTSPLSSTVQTGPLSRCPCCFPLLSASASCLHLPCLQRTVSKRDSGKVAAFTTQ